jgi:glycosyltransferase involved in cell wall biosynthesis
MSKPRVLICQPYLASRGGGHGVAAWVLQALREDFALDLCTLDSVDLDAVNRTFGTSLRAGDFQLRLGPRRYVNLVRSMPTGGALLEMSLTVRWALELDRRLRYDLLFSTYNEVDFARPGLQYVHFPWAYLPRPEAEMRWIHRIPGFLSGYRRGCLWLARGSWRGLRRNLTIANSQFTSSRIRDVHGIDSAVVYPPIIGEFPNIPWERRLFAVAAVGRLDPLKRWHLAVEIVEAVRRRGHDLSLTLFGHPDRPDYGRLLDGLAQSRPWFRIRRDLSRDELARALASHRYGIHPMRDEHFGMAPAELQRAGCLAFVHNSGGAVEIVDRDQRLVFADVEDAAAKLARVIEDPLLEGELRAQAAARGDWFTGARFCDAIRGIVRKQIAQYSKIRCSEDL